MAPPITEKALKHPLFSSQAGPLEEKIDINSCTTLKEKSAHHSTGAFCML